MLRIVRRWASSPFEGVRELLIQKYQPVHLKIDGGKEEDGLHCRITIVSDTFEGTTLVQRHRDVMGAFKDNFEQGLHALSILAKTPAEWQAELHRQQRS